MQQLELVDREPGSDQGNLRWYPKGVLIKRLLEEKVGRLVRSAGAMEVETPEMYDYHHPCMEKYLARFPARQYRLLSGDKPYFMRFAATTALRAGAFFLPPREIRGTGGTAAAARFHDARYAYSRR